MNKKKNWKVYIPLTAVVVIILALGIAWYIDYSKYVSTDDAHVDSDNVSVSAKILGRISKVYAEEGDSVHAGELLAELDSTDLQAQKQQAEANKAQAEANKEQAEAKYQSDKKNLTVLEVNLSRAQEDFDRAKSQFAGDVITKEQYDHTKKALESAHAQLESAKAQVEVSKAQVTTTGKSVGTAGAQINIIKTQLSNTKLYAPIDGVAAKRWLLPGDVVQPGQSVYTINNNKRFWIIVYLEETKLGNIHVGQRAKFTIDAFSGETFVGHVFSIASNTASQFSLIPANNASGNFTKVTQRIPIKVSIDGTESGKKASQFNFLSGMSSVVKISRK